MEKSTIKKLLLIGNHALSINKRIKKIDDLALIKQTLMYKTGDPFLDNFDNFVQIDTIKHSYKNAYNFDDLTYFLKLKFKENTILDSPALIIGNPSELLFQSALTALLENENKAVKSSIIILLYPIGMVGHDTRKELSSLIYLLKKNAVQTLLIRNSETEIEAVHKIILNDFSMHSIYELENHIEGLEHLIGKPKEVLF
jgi:hypothetical protein